MREARLRWCGRLIRRDVELRKEETEEEVDGFSRFFLKLTLLFFLLGECTCLHPQDNPVE